MQYIMLPKQFTSGYDYAYMYVLQSSTKTHRILDSWPMDSKWVTSSSTFILFFCRSLLVQYFLHRQLPRPAEEGEVCQLVSPTGRPTPANHLQCGTCKLL